MSRYFTRSKSRASLYVEDDYYRPEPTALGSPTVPDHEATDTGLLDARGDAIWRAPRPVGFGRDAEW